MPAESSNAPWSVGKVSRVNFNLNALKIAASVFSQITNTETKTTPDFGGRSLEHPLPRTLTDFRESVDAVFKAAGLEKVEWEK